MKKFSLVLALVLVLAMAFSTVAFADAFNVEPNPKITVPFATPNVDGNVDASEGWSVAADFSNTTCGHYWAHNPMTTQANLYYAYDNDGVYIAAVVTEGLSAIDMAGVDVTGMNQFNYSTGFDTLDFDEDTGENNYGWNGDVMGIMFDPFGGFISQGFSGGADFSAWYMIGLHEGDVARIYKSHTSTNGEITDMCKAAGKKTEAGWDFEVMIPWDIIVADTDDCSMGFVEITKEMLVKAGSYLRVGAMYHDRFYDVEAQAIGTWGRYIVVPTTLEDGTPGPGGVGQNIASYGIEIELGSNNSVVFDDVPTEGQWYSEGVYYCAGKGYITGTSVTPPLFAPNGQLTREQFVTILARVAGAKLADYTETKFTDVDASAWYGASVIWANEEGYVNGVGDGSKFGVGQAMTREQLATMFFRYAEKNGVKVDGAVDLNTYEDGAAVANWAASAVAWAVDAKLLGSTTTGKLVLSPQMTVTRAQAAKIFMSYDQLK